MQSRQVLTSQIVCSACAPDSQLAFVDLRFPLLVRLMPHPLTPSFHSLPCAHRYRLVSTSREECALFSSGAAFQIWKSMISTPASLFVLKLFWFGTLERLDPSLGVPRQRNLRLAAMGKRGAKAAVPDSVGLKGAFAKAQAKAKAKEASSQAAPAEPAESTQKRPRHGAATPSTDVRCCAGCVGGCCLGCRGPPCRLGRRAPRRRHGCGARLAGRCSPRALWRRAGSASAAGRSA